MVYEPIEAREHREEIAATGTEHSDTSRVTASITLLAWLVAIAGIAVVALLGFRLGFEMGEANATNDVVDFVYDVTGPLVEPFEGIGETRSVDGGGVFRPETAIAMGAYLVAAALVMMTLYAWAGFFSANHEAHSSHGRALGTHH